MRKGDRLSGSPRCSRIRTGITATASSSTAQWCLSGCPAGGQAHRLLERNGKMFVLAAEPQGYIRHGCQGGHHAGGCREQRVKLIKGQAEGDQRSARRAILHHLGAVGRRKDVRFIIASFEGKTLVRSTRGSGYRPQAGGDERERDPVVYKWGPADAEPTRWWWSVNCPICTGWWSPARGSKNS